MEDSSPVSRILEECVDVNGCSQIRLDCGALKPELTRYQSGMKIRDHRDDIQNTSDPSLRI